MAKPVELVEAPAPVVLKGNQRMAPRQIGPASSPASNVERRTRFTARQFHGGVRRDILFRYLEMQTKESIAETYHTDVRTINVILADPEIREEQKRVMGLLTQNIAQRLNVLAAPAIDTMRDTMRGENESKLKLDAAKAVIENASDFQKKAESIGEGDMAAQILQQIGKGIAAKLPIIEADAEVVE